MLCGRWSLNLPWRNYKTNDVFLWIGEVHMWVTWIPILVFGKAPVFSGSMSELLNVLRVAKVLKHLNDLMAIIDVTSQSTREFHIDRHCPTYRSEVIRDLSYFGLCTFIIPHELADQAWCKLSYHYTNVMIMEYLKTDGLKAAVSGADPWPPGVLEWLPGWSGVPSESFF
jgi:hypothetical protein